MPMDVRGPEDSTLNQRPRERMSRSGEPTSPEFPVLVLMWSRDEPERVGELVCLDRLAPGRRGSIGRATSTGPDGEEPLTLARLSPAGREDRGPLRAPQLSRWQLAIECDPEGALSVAQRGRGALSVNERIVERSQIHRGDRIYVEDRLLFLVGERPRRWLDGREPRNFAFGEADPHGIVGESSVIWALRTELAFLGSRPEHVLVHGPSGAGKELAVRAIHAQSARSRRELVARNAA